MCASSYDGYFKIINPFNSLPSLVLYENSIIRKKLKNVLMDTGGKYITILGEG